MTTQSPSLKCLCRPQSGKKKDTTSHNSSIWTHEERSAQSQQQQRLSLFILHNTNQRSLGLIVGDAVAHNVRCYGFPYLGLSDAGVMSIAPRKAKD